MAVSVLIPAYQPDEKLVELVEALCETDIPAITIVNDGSAKASEPVFDAIASLPKVTILKHAVNLGKGAALKTGLNHLYGSMSADIGVVTADADGQHAVEDICKIAKLLEARPKELVLGVRAFDKLEQHVPWMNYLGNRMTRRLFKHLVGQEISDTQTGLRGIPVEIIPSLLNIRANRYEFELEMLLHANSQKIKIHTETIQTIYLNENESSHFNPFWDSIKIYFVLLRHMLGSMMTATIDFAIFVLIWYFAHPILLAQFAARFIAMIFQYSWVRRYVFNTKQAHLRTFPKFLLLVVVSGLISYAGMMLLNEKAGLHLLLAKLAVEAVIFIANFAIQRDFIFVSKSK